MWQLLDNHNSGSLPAHTPAELSLCPLLLWSHLEWHDTAGKETGSLWDLLLTLLQCNGPPSSHAALQGAAPDGHTAFPAAPGPRDSTTGPFCITADLSTCRVMQTLEGFPWWRATTMVGLNVQCDCSHQLPLSSLQAQPLGAWTLRTQQPACRTEGWRMQPLLFHCLVCPTKRFLNL